MPMLPAACARPSSARSRALPRACSWATCACLLLLSTACAQPVQILAQAPALPASLAQPCWAGPDWPAGEATLAEVLEVVRGREAAAALCRAKHAALVAAWPR